MVGDGNSVRRLLLINANSRRFDDPKFAFDPFAFQGGCEGFHETVNVGVRRLRGQTQDGNACVTTGKENERIGEIEIKSDETPPFRSTVFDQLGVNGLLHALPGHRGDVVAGGAQYFLPVQTEILIELEFHAAGSSGTVT
jgi:hypothetical protein